MMLIGVTYVNKLIIESFLQADTYLFSISHYRPTMRSIMATLLYINMLAMLVQFSFLNMNELLFKLCYHTRQLLHCLLISDIHNTIHFCKYDKVCQPSNYTLRCLHSLFFIACQLLTSLYSCTLIWFALYRPNDDVTPHSSLFSIFLIIRTDKAHI